MWKGDNLDIPKITVPEKSGKDHIMDLVVGVAAGIPVVGGPISVGIDKHVPTQYKKKIEVWMHQVTEAINWLVEQVGKERDSLYEDEKFLAIVYKCSREAIMEYRPEKIVVFRNIIMNSVIMTDIDEDLQFYFLKCVDSMTIAQMRMLQFFNNPEKVWLTVFQDLPNYTQTSRLTVFSDFYPEYKNEKTYLSSAMKDLINMGLIQNTEPNITVSGHGACQKMTTDLGDKLIEFVTTPDKYDECEREHNGAK